MDNKTFDVLQKSLSKHWVALEYQGETLKVWPVRWEGYNLVVRDAGGRQRLLDYGIIQSARLLQAAEIPSMPSPMPPQHTITRSATSGDGRVVDTGESAVPEQSFLRRIIIT